MNDQQGILWACSLCAFGVTLGIYEFIVRHLLSNPSYGPFESFLFVILASGAIYTVLFKSIVMIYGRCLFPVFSPTQSIRGKWYHITTIEEPVREIRYGDVEIRNDLGVVSVNASNRIFEDGQDKYRSSFYSIAANIVPTHLTIFYQSFGAKRPQNPNRNGMMELVIIAKGRFSKKPLKLEGSWKDTAPSAYSGTIMFFSKEREWEAEKQKEIEHSKEGRPSSDLRKSRKLADESNKE